MNRYLSLIVLFALIYTNWAAVMQSGPSTHKDFPNQCYVSSQQKGYPVGENTPIGNCARIICNPDYSFEIDTCGTVGAPEGYHNELDLTKPYPDCCVNLVKN